MHGAWLSDFSFRAGLLREYLNRIFDKDHVIEPMRPISKRNLEQCGLWQTIKITKCIGCYYRPTGKSVDMIIKGIDVYTTLSTPEFKESYPRLLRFNFRSTYMKGIVPFLSHFGCRLSLFHMYGYKQVPVQKRIW